MKNSTCYEMSTPSKLAKIFKFFNRSFAYFEFFSMFSVLAEYNTGELP